MRTLPTQAEKLFGKQSCPHLATQKSRISNKEVQRYEQACNGGSHG